jgi:aspartate kinase
VAVSLTIDTKEHLPEIIKELAPFGTVEIDENQTIVSVVGHELAETKDILTKLFDSISSIPVRMVSYGGSHHNVSLLVHADHKKKTLQLLNKGLFGL